MKSFRYFDQILLVLLALALGACSTTRPVQEWRNSGYSGTIDSVLVIAAIERSTQRRVYEDLFSESIGAYGAEGIPSYTLITSGLEITRQQIESAVRGRSIDAVLVTRLLGVEEKVAYEPPTTQTYYRSYDQYYRHALTEVSPGYYRRFNVLTIESTLYDTRTGELIWSMQSEAIEPSTPRPVIEDQIDLTIDRLAAQGLLPG